MGGWVFDQATGWVSQAVVNGLQLLWNLLAQFAFTSPDVTGLPQVAAVSSRSLLVVNTAYGLAVLTAAVLVMTRDTLQIRYGIGDLAPRLVIGLIAANLATPLCSNLTQGANTLTQALTSDPITSPDSFKELDKTITGPIARNNTGTQAVLTAAIGILLLALTVMLFLTWLIRLGLLVILTGIAPAALACHGLPHTDPVARLWWRSYLATLGVVTAQAFALHTTLTVFLSPTANLPALGIPTDPAGITNLMIVTCMLWATVRIPALARRYVTHARPAPGANLVRVLLVQQLTRGLTRRPHPTPRPGSGGGSRVTIRFTRPRPSHP